LIKDLEDREKQDYDAICAVVPEFKKHSLKEYIITRLMICSRVFGTIISEDNDYSLVPFAGD
jgi:hypothetical protein